MLLTPPFVFVSEFKLKLKPCQSLNKQSLLGYSYGLLAGHRKAMSKVHTESQKDRKGQKSRGACMACMTNVNLTGIPFNRIDLANVSCAL